MATKKAKGPATGPANQAQVRFTENSNSDKVSETGFDFFWGSGLLGALNAGVLVNPNRPIYVFNTDLANVHYVALDAASALASAIVLTNALFITMNAHAVDAVEHGAGADAVNFPLVSPLAIDLPTMIARITEMLAAYPAHDADAKLIIGWAFHNAQYAGSDLASVVPPTNATECAARINDIKIKYNVHDAHAVIHTVGSVYPEATVAATPNIAAPTNASDGIPIAPGTGMVLASGPYTGIRSSSALVFGYQADDNIVETGN